MVAFCEIIHLLVLTIGLGQKRKIRIRRGTTYDGIYFLSIGAGPSNK